MLDHSEENKKNNFKEAQDADSETEGKASAKIS
jgi:hypothetical protein